MGVALNATVTTATLFKNVTTSVDSPSIDSAPLSERDRERMEFYQTYDIMTGVRIAATLGSFFTMMVLLVLYKSKCKSRADETLEAAITAAVAEEEELEAVLSQTKYDFKMHSGHRQSLGNMSAPAYTRFSSIGGYGGLMNPPSRRYDRGARGRISLPASDSSFRYFTSAPTSISSQDRSPRLWKSYDEEEENELEEVEENEDIDSFDHTKFLQVPHSYSSRLKSSNFNDSGCLRIPNYYERRRSSSNEYFSGEDRRFDHPNIHVIQATPQISPSESNSGLQEEYSKLENQIGVVERRLAPLASIGSCSAISSIAESSLGSDSVFINNEMVEEDDTDKDQNEEELSSTKSERDCTNKKYRIVPAIDSSGSHVPTRRFSDSCTLRTAVDADARALPIVTNLVSNASNQITSTSLYKNECQSANTSSSTTSLTSNFSSCTSTSSDKPISGVFSRIAIIDVGGSPVKTDSEKNRMKRRALLSRSEPKTINTFPWEPSAKEGKTLSLKDLVQTKFWSKETLF